MPAGNGAGIFEDDHEPWTLPDAVRLEGERRQLTIMFCDLVGSTDLAYRMDPEDLREILRLYQGICAKIVDKYGGFIAQFQGDGIVIYFGYPTANERAVEAAVRAGLDILRSIPKTPALDEAHVQARIGIATGLVVVGDHIGEGPSAQTAVTGQAPSLAARLQAIAEPGTLVIADSSRQFLGSLFELTERGLFRLKGVDREVMVWRVDAEREHDRRFEAVRRSRIHIGRCRELEGLGRGWARACAGQGNAILVSADPGTGKSALLRAWLDGVAPEDAVRITFQASPQHMNSPWYPLLVHLRRAAGLHPDDPPDVQLGKLEAMLSERNRAEGARLLAPLLSISASPRHAGPPLSPEQIKATTVALLIDEVLALAERRPIILIVEDAQWLDPTTEDLLATFIGRLPGHRVFALIAARAEYRSGWRSLPQASVMSLSRLDIAEAEELIRATAGAVTLDRHIVDHILRRAEGVPLFIEELTRSILELPQEEPGATGPSHRLPETPIVPSTLQNIVMARLDMLGPAKHVAQIGAVIGRAFSLDMLRGVAGLPDRDLLTRLDALISSGLVSARVGAWSRSYVFKHALVQDAIYESLLRARRKALHAQIAGTIEAEYPELVETEPETVAHHLRSAQDFGAAATYALKAGQLAAARFANVEAIAHFRNGIRDLESGRPKDDGILEFRLHLGLAQAAYAAHGPAHNDTVAAYARAQDLVGHLADPEQQFLLLWGIFSSYHFAARFDLAEQPALKAMKLARTDGDPAHICQAHRMLGYLGFFRGELAGALGHFAEIRRLWAPARHRDLAAAYGADCRAGAAGFESVALCLTGRAREAVELSRSNIAYARGLGHPASIGWALASAAYVFYFLRDRHAAASVADEGFAYCLQHDIAAWFAHCKVFRAWAMSSGSDVAEAEAVIADIKDAETRTKLGLPVLRAVAAEMLLLSGRPDVAHEQSAIALEEVAETGQIVFRPLLQHLSGLCSIAMEEQRTDAREELLSDAEASARVIGAALFVDRSRNDRKTTLLAIAGGEDRARLIRSLLGA